MLKLENIAKVYRTTEVQTQALDSISLEIPDREFLAIMGPSGCGKSTLLNVLGLIDQPTSGHYWFFGEDVAGYNEERLTTLRRSVGIGFVFQSFNLIDDLNRLCNPAGALSLRRGRDVRPAEIQALPRWKAVSRRHNEPNITARYGRAGRAGGERC